MKLDISIGEKDMNLEPQDILGRQLTNDEMKSAEAETFFCPWPIHFSNKASIKIILNQAKKDIPTAYRDFFPRMYHGTDSFRDWRHANLAGLLIITAAHTQIDFIEHFQAATNLLRSAMLWQSCGAPMFFVKPDFLESVMETDLPKDFDFSDFKLPFDALTFVLPHKHRLSCRGKFINWFSIAHATEKTETSYGVVTSAKPVNKIIISTSIGFDGFFSCGFAYDSLNDFAAKDENWLREVCEKETGGDYDSNEIAFLYQLFRTAMKLVLIMEALPELIDRPTRPLIVRKGNHQPETWQPNIIGKRFRVEHHATGEGSHASPRMHPRRGHVRQQKVGARYGICECGESRGMHFNRAGACFDADCDCIEYRSVKVKRELKTVWIRPTWVNAAIES